MFYCSKSYSTLLNNGLLILVLIDYGLNQVQGIMKNEKSLWLIIVEFLSTELGTKLL